MDESKKYSAFSIPQRGIQNENGAPPPARSAGEDAAAFIGAKFAEIDIEPNPNRPTAGETALRFFSSITPAQTIEQRSADPIRQRFYNMRSLASDRPFARDDSELFYRQAKFMEDFADDYEGDTKFFMYYPYYQHMGYEQLRTYFTWRTKVRQGEIMPTSGSYVFLYVYELLSGIGVDDPLDGLYKLVSIWNSLLKYAPALENYLPRWIKDYHVYYELPHSFSDFIIEHNLQKYYSLMLILEEGFKDSLELWNNVSSYDVMKSKFYNEGNEQLFQNCFSAVIDGIQECYKNRAAGIEDMLVYRVSNRIQWHPFRRALFRPWLDQPDRRVILPGQERYYCKNSKWTASLPIYYSSQKDFVGYIIRKTESCLRQTVKYKYKLTADIKKGGGFRELKELDIENAEFDGVIEKSVTNFYRDITRTVVTVDHKNLARIREEAQGTQEKLIVPETAEDFGIKIRDKGVRDKNTLGCLPFCDPDRQLAPENDDDNDEYNDAEYDSWNALKDALTPVELRALSIALHGGMGIKAFADENGIMLEVLADSINEKAADYIGDNLLETGDVMTVYNEYKESIEAMLE